MGSKTYGAAGADGGGKEHAAVSRSREIKADRLNHLTVRHDSLLEERRTWEADWKELARHFLPRKCRLEDEAVTGTNKGGLRGGVLDSTPYFAMRDLASGLHGGLTSPARPWFNLTVRDSRISRDAGVKEFLGEVTEKMRDVFHYSNFYNAVHQVYAELGTFGSAFCFVMEDKDTTMRFIPLTAGEYCLDVNEKGRVDTVFHTIRMTLRQIVGEFGLENIPEQLREMYKLPGQWNERFSVVHAVFPEAVKKSGASGAGQRSGRFSSVYYLDRWGSSNSGKMLTQRAILREGFFYEFPGFGVRWDVTGGDVYGRGPAMDTLPASRKLQQITATTIKALHKTVDPPMAVPPGLENASLLPGGTTPVSSSEKGAIYPLLQLNYDIKSAWQAVLDEREQIREGLFNNLFRAMLNSDRRTITAAEVNAREEEKMLLIGPVLERLHDELFIPLIDITFAILLRRGDLGKPEEWPPAMNRMFLKVEFVSMLAQAQKMVATAGLEKFVGFIGGTAQMAPEVLDAVNPDALVDTYADYLGTPVKIMRGQDGRDAIRQQRQQAQAQAEQQQALMASVQATRDLGQANMDGSALGALMGGMGQAMEAQSAGI